MANAGDLITATTTVRSFHYFSASAPLTPDYFWTCPFFILNWTNTLFNQVFYIYRYSGSSCLKVWTGNSGDGAGQAILSTSPNQFPQWKISFEQQAGTPDFTLEMWAKLGTTGYPIYYYVPGFGRTDPDYKANRGLVISSGYEAFCTH